MISEDFYESGIRHWMDACILEQKEEYDNAVYLQGFAAECVLKMIMESSDYSGNIRKYSHYGEVLFQDIKRMFSWDMALTVIDPALGLRLSAISLPEILFKDHPERRYFKDDIYSKNDAQECKNATELLIREMVFMRLDGYI